MRGLIFMHRYAQQMLLTFWIVSTSLGCGPQAAQDSAGSGAPTSPTAASPSSMAQPATQPSTESHSGSSTDAEAPEDGSDPDLGQAVTPTPSEGGEEVTPPTVNDCSQTEPCEALVCPVGQFAHHACSVDGVRRCRCAYSKSER